MDQENAAHRQAGFTLAIHLFLASLLPLAMFAYVTQKWNGGIIPTVIEFGSYPFMPFGFIAAALFTAAISVLARTLWKYGLYDETEIY